MMRPWHARSSDYHPYMVDSVDELRHEAARRMGAALWGGATVDPSGGHQLPG